MKKGFLLILILSTGALAQTPVPSPSNTTSPNLTASTNIAVHALQEGAKQLNTAITEFNQNLMAVAQDIRKQAPGWHLDPKTIQVVRDEPGQDKQGEVKK